MIKQTIDLLGRSGTDRVTGFTGVVTTVSFDLYGCVQLALTPSAKDGKYDHGHWFDVQRVKLSTAKKAMEAPDFEAMAAKPADFNHGPADKPAPRA